VSDDHGGAPGATSICRDGKRKEEEEEEEKEGGKVLRRKKEREQCKVC
jgi:hypothetical protein